MTFIKLTMLNDQNVFINMDLIIDIYPRSGDTVISMGENYTITVKETATEIFKIGGIKVFHDN